MNLVHRLRLAWARLQRPTVAFHDGPTLSVPTAAEMRLKHDAELAAWHRHLKGLGGRRPVPLTRRALDRVLMDMGYRPRRHNDETLFERRVGPLIITIFPQLKSRAESPTMAPRQIATLLTTACTERFDGVYQTISGANNRPVQLRAGDITDRDFALDSARIGALVQRAEAAVLSQDPESALTEFAGYETSRPGSAGLLHLAALACLGDRAILKGYQAARARGQSAGFVPYVTNEMIDRALAETFRPV